MEETWTVRHPAHHIIFLRYRHRQYKIKLHNMPHWLIRPGFAAFFFVSWNNKLLWPERPFLFGYWSLYKSFFNIITYFLSYVKLPRFFQVNTYDLATFHKRYAVSDFACSWIKIRKCRLS